jgi:hypothetical protein
MRRILVYLNFVPPIEAEPQTHNHVTVMVDAELVRLTKRVPRTNAEKEFHVWLSAWKKRNEGGTC